MAVLYIMRGVPGVGKSTFIQKSLEDIHVVSRDAIRFSMLQEGEQYFAHEKAVTAQFYAEIREYLKNDEDVIADATHIGFGALRKTLRTTLGLKDIKVFVVNFEYEDMLEVCLRHNAQRSGRALLKDDVIQEQYARWQDTPPLQEMLDKLESEFPQLGHISIWHIVKEGKK